MKKDFQFVPTYEVARDPKRGDVYYADLTEIEQYQGCEQTGRRPVLVLQNNMGNKMSGTTIVATMTTNIFKNMPTHVKFNNQEILPRESAVCLEQIKTIDKSRLEDYRGNAGNVFMKEIENAIQISLGMEKTEKVKEHANLMEIPKGSVKHMVKKPVLYDEQKENWLEMLEKQLLFFTDGKQYLINLQVEKEKLDNEIEDILQYIESTNYNTVQGYKVYKTVREKRIQRRAVMDEIEILQNIVENLDFETMRRAYQSSISKIENAKKQKEKRMEELQKKIEVAG